MSDAQSQRLPIEINLHRKSRLLSIRFADGAQFELPCEYLRVFSRAAEVRAMRQPVVGKENVNIDRIEPQGQYAIRLIFDDGHDTGIYSWDSLYELGLNREQNWAEYLHRLEEMGYQRQPDPSERPGRRIKILFFSYLVQKLRRDHLDLVLPEDLTTVGDLLESLRRREPENAHLLADKALRITVNKQFSELFTRLEDGDEVALVPNSPVPPAPPKPPARH